MRLLLVRHGETDWNVAKKIQGGSDIPLNDTGRAQARELGAELQRHERAIGGIYTSRLSRARETAEIIASGLGLEVKPLDGLEEMKLGLWEGMNWKDVETEYPEEFREWYEHRRHTRTPQGESYQDVLDRLVPALQNIAAAETEDIVVVTHSANIMSLLSCIHDTPFSEMVKRYKTENCNVVVVEDSVIKELKYQEQQKSRAQFGS